MHFQQLAKSQSDLQSDLQSIITVQSAVHFQVYSVDDSITVMNS